MKDEIFHIYNILLKSYGYQGWWPLLQLETLRSNNGYHPQNYEFPLNSSQRFEISVGGILTQNASWKQVEKALLEFLRNDLFKPEKLLNFNENFIKGIIKPTGYFNQKYKKLIYFTRFFVSNDDEFAKVKNFNRDVLKSMRKALLNVWGIGKETADSILLYAYKQPIFVIDAYTKRIFSRLGFEFKNYDDLQSLFHKNLIFDFRIFQEYHALLVEHAKQKCKTNPDCRSCTLKIYCEFYLKNILKNEI